MRRAAALLVILAACGDDVRLAPDATPIACDATFHGNFDELVRSPDRCARLDQRDGRWFLEIAIPVHAIDAPLDVEVELGASPMPGAWTTSTTTSWSALASQRIGNGVCLYRAGSDAVPRGSIDLTLDSLALDTRTIHGAFDLTQYVLTPPGTDCGDRDTESLHLSF